MPALNDMKPRNDRRAKLIRLVHIGKRDLALGDDAYRDLLERLTGKRSAKSLGAAQLDKVLTEMKGLGFKVQRPRVVKTPAQRRRHGPRDGQQAFITALWISLAQLGAVHDRNDSAIDAFVKRQTGIDKLTWLTPQQAHRVIEALKQWCAREGYEVPSLPETDITPGLDAKRALCLALWRKLEAARGDCDEFADEFMRLDSASKDELEDLAERMGHALQTATR